MIKVNRRAGFTLLETMLSLALTGILIGMMGIMVRQWIGSWNRGSARMAELESISLAEGRIAQDLKFAVAFPFHPDQPAAYFLGDANKIIFISDVTPRDPSGHLRVILFENDPDLGVIRRVALYDGLTPIDQSHFADPVSLLPPPYHLAFTFQDEEKADQAEWKRPGLPESIKIHIQIGDARGFSDRLIMPLAPLAYACARASDMKACTAFITRGQIPMAEPQSKANSKQTMPDKTGAPQP